MRYILTRILLVLPTILLVSVIAFFLSKLVPGDQADALLVLQGSNPENTISDNAEYRRNYRQLNLHKAYFYFTITPHFYPSNLNEIDSKYRRSSIQSLLHQKFAYHSIIKFLEIKEQFLIHGFETLDSVKLAHDDVSGMSDHTKINEAQFILSRINFMEDMDEIDFQLTTLGNAFPSETKHIIKDFRIAIERLRSSKSAFQYPVFHWHGLDNQYHIWLRSLLQFDLGISFKDGRQVADKISKALKWSLSLLLLNLIITLCIAVPMGIYSGRYPGSLFDKWAVVLSLLLYSIPVFWLASMLIIFFTTDDYGMKIFPVAGYWYTDGSMNFVDLLVKYSGQLILPVICLVLNDIAYLSRLVRVNFLQESSKLYSVFSRAKGLSSQQTAFRHILPNTLIPLVTIITGSIPASLAGSLVVEVIFNIPGMGRLMHDSIFGADWNVVFGILVMISLVTVLIYLIGDVIYGLLNPKIKFY